MPTSPRLGRAAAVLAAVLLLSACRGPLVGLRPGAPSQGSLGFGERLATIRTCAEALTTIESASRLAADVVADPARPQLARAAALATDLAKVAARHPELPVSRALAQMAAALRQLSLTKAGDTAGARAAAVRLATSAEGAATTCASVGG